MDILDKPKSKFVGVKVGREFTMQAFHAEMQERRENGEDLTFKAYLKEVYGDEYTPESFYRDAGLGDLGGIQVQKVLNTSELSRWMFPEILRDAIRRGLEYSPIYPRLITGDERIDGTGVTMPSMDFRPFHEEGEFTLRDTNEAASITESYVVVWAEKQVSVNKKARGLLQSYESIAFTPLNLATVYFEEVGTRLGADLDTDFIDVLINGDQAGGSEAAPVIGATVANTLAYKDLARAWLRFRRINRTSSAMVVNETDALDIMLMEEFQRTRYPNGSPDNAGGTALTFQTPLPTSQDIFVHHSVPTKKIVFVDRARAVVKLTAMPLLIESERIVRRQLEGQFASIMTGFANVFKDGRMVLDWSTTIVTNPGPTVYT
jgi:hypothetical protein